MAAAGSRAGGAEASQHSRPPLGVEPTESPAVATKCSGFDRHEPNGEPRPRRGRHRVDQYPGGACDALGIRSAGLRRQQRRREVA